MANEIEDFIPESLKPHIPQPKVVKPILPKPNMEERICERCNKRHIPKIVHTYSVTTERDVSATNIWQLAVIIFACFSKGLGLLLFLFFGLNRYKTVSHSHEIYECGFCGSRNLLYTPEQIQYRQR